MKYLRKILLVLIAISLVQANLSIIDTLAANTVLDAEFEAYLDAQGFPESYKQYLRELHEEHPNWVFTALHTGLDFETAVANEQSVSYIDGTSSYSLSFREVDSSGNYILKEGSTWYLANEDAVSIYLDPRNYLTEKYILAFETYAYSSAISTSSVQSILNSSFMAGTDETGQSYADLFMAAGAAYNINPLFLAAHVIQECGYSGSESSSGAMFSYTDSDGRTRYYHGVYNLFNIGAYSTAANPVIAGLIYANGGSTGNGELELGDINLDRTVDSLDYVALRKYLTGSKSLSDNELLAADVNDDDTIDALDYVKIRNSLNGKATIESENSNVYTNLYQSLNMRSSASTGSSIVCTLSYGASVTLLSDTITNGFYYVSYVKNGTTYTGYVTAEALKDSSYGRPWLSTQSSIYGGAQFEYESYVQKGQYTLYLRRFNVNPNGYYAVYTHQYMTNLRAAASNAYTSYQSYVSNGLLDQGMEFIIPVYLNMPDVEQTDLYEIRY